MIKETVDNMMRSYNGAAGGWTTAYCWRHRWIHKESTYPNGVCVILEGLCTMSLLVWLPGPMFLLVGICSWSYVPSGRVPVQRGLCSGGLCPGGSLSRGVCPGVSVGRPPPPESEKWTIHIILECFLVRFVCYKEIW